MKRRWIALMGILIGMGTSNIMQTYLSIFMPSIAAELGGMYLYNWVFGAYMLASTVSIPLFGKLADMFGRKKLYLTGLILFTSGLLTSALSVSMPMLVFCRALMGIGAGAVTPAALGMTGELFGEKDFAKVFGLMGVIQVMANLIGPLLSGLLSTALSWRYGFLLFFPLELVCAVLIFLGVPNGYPARLDGDNKQNEPRAAIKDLDWKGALLLSTGLTGMILGLQFINWDKNIEGICLFIISVFVLWLLFRLEKNCADPVLPIPLLIAPAIRNGMIAVFLLGIINNSSSTYLSLYFQNVLGRSAANASMLMLPMLLSAGIASALCGRLSKSWQNKASLLLWLMIGLCFMGITLLGNLLDGFAAVLLSIPVGFGLGLILPLYLGGSQTHADASNRSVSGGMVQLSRNLGGTIGVSLLGILISGTIPVKIGMNGIFLCLAAVGITGFVYSNKNNRHLKSANKNVGVSDNDPLV